MEYIGYKGIKVPIGTHEGKNVIIGADHRGLTKKEGVKRYFARCLNSFSLEDVGTYSEESCDYPVIAENIARAFRGGKKKAVGIGICGTGLGMSMVAGKIPGFYPARCLSVEDAKISRQHNNSNFLALSADATELEKMIEIIEAWLRTPFGIDAEKETAEERERFLRRYKQTTDIEANWCY